MAVHIQNAVIPATGFILFLALSRLQASRIEGKLLLSFHFKI